MEKNNIVLVRMGLKKTGWVILLLSVIVLGLVYLGYVYGIRKANSGRVTRLTPSPAAEVPFGDENLETDENYQRAMRENVGESGGIRAEEQWLNYKSTIQGLSFDYPVAKYFLEEKSGEQPIIFIDKEMIIIPEAYGGPLTAVEISTVKLEKGKTWKDYFEEVRVNFNVSSIREKTLPSGWKGKWISGVWQGFMEGTKVEDVVLEGKNGVVSILFIPGRGVEEKDFERMMKSLKLE